MKQTYGHITYKFDYNESAVDNLVTEYHWRKIVEPARWRGLAHQIIDIEACLAKDFIGRP